MGFVCSNQVIDRDFILSGTYELEVASQRVPCQAQLSPLYDPEMLRVRGKRYAYQRPTERISAVRSPVGQGQDAIPIKIVPVATIPAATRRRIFGPSPNQMTPISAAKITDVSRRAETVPKGASVLT